MLREETLSKQQKNINLLNPRQHCQNDQIDRVK